MKRYLLIVLSVVICAVLGLAFAPIETSFAARRMIAKQLVLTQRYEFAHRIYESLHEQGDVIGTNNLAAVELVQPAAPNKQTRRRAKSHFRSAAQAGLAVAEYNLSTSQLPWYRSEKAIARLKKHLKKAAALGDEFAPLLLREGMKPADRLRILAERGDIGAARRYAELNRLNDNEEQQIWGLRIAAEAGEMTAMSDLGRVLGVKSTYPFTRSFRRGADASTQRHQSDQQEQSATKTEAEIWLTRAAEAGSILAASLMGDCLYLATDFCNQKDSIKAAYWYELAIQNSNKTKPYTLPPRIEFTTNGAIRMGSPRTYLTPMRSLGRESARELAKMYVLGDGVVPDVNKAHMLLKEHLPAKWKQWDILYNHLEIRDQPKAQQDKRLRDVSLAHIAAKQRSVSTEIVRLLESNAIRMYSVLDVQRLREMNGLDLEDIIVGRMMHGVRYGYLVTGAFNFPDGWSGAGHWVFLIPNGTPVPTGYKGRNRFIILPVSSNSLQ